MFQNTANQDLMFARYENAIYIYIYENINFIIAEDTIHVKQNTYNL